jgi:GNAT superfamily N-acetyltransferase
MFSSLPVCRPALPSDRTDVLEFTKFIWGGHDYIQYVWDDWLADPRGLLAVAEYAGHAVALGKATYVAEGQWWLEGLRVDPRYQGLKIGSHIFEYLDNWWQRHAGGAFRLMTAWDRVQVHHLCERFGWQKIGEVKSWEADAMVGGPHPFRPVASADVPDVLRFASAHLDYCWHLADLGWVFGVPDHAMLASQAQAGRLYRSADSAALLGCWEDVDDGPRTMGVSFIACALEALPTTLSDVRRLAASRGFDRVLWHAPVRDNVEAVLAAAGYESIHPGSAFLFGKESGAVSSASTMHPAISQP